MMRKWVLGIVIILFLIALAIGVVQVASDDDPAEFLHDRPWVTVMPKSPTAGTHVLFLASESPYGATIHGSNYRHLVNLMTHELQEDQLEITSLQDGRRAKALVRTWECDEAPGDLDLCMDLKVGPLKIRMYSRKEWKQSDSVPAGIARVNEEQWPETVPGEVPFTEGVPNWFRTAAE